MNDQSGTQWDGLRHFGLLNEGFFYGNTPATDIKGGELDVSDPLKVKAESVKLGIQHWSNHGINGRGILLDMVAWYTRDGSPLPYDPTKTSVIPLADLKACAEYQGVSFKVGDILLIRMGWTQRYYASSMEEKKQWGSQFGQEQYVGIENTTAMREWLWDNHFAAVASDVAALETWPCEEGKTHLHQTLIGMYGSPIGEFFDLERLAEVCAEQKRFTFLFTSNPLNSLGGASSLANAGAIF
ncbi:hypothetical protein MNV49_003974 [Pseudohyphozyma bogoriensis]|nr:hypothetical protein MNV49_003974 [Pseudohyphozyma bogoriensis]